MIRLFHTYFPARTVLLTVSEIVLLTAAFLLAVLISSGTAFNANVFLLYENGIARVGFVIAVVLALMYYFGLYDTAVLSNPREVFTRMVGVLGCTFVSLGLAYFVFPEVTLDREVLWMGILGATVVLALWRVAFSLLNRSDRFAERALVLGDGPLAERLIDEIRQRPELGVRVAGSAAHVETATGIPFVPVEDITEFVKRKNIQRVIVTMADRRGKLPVADLLQLKTDGVRIQDGPDYYASVTGKISIESLHLGWLLFSPGFHVSTAFRAYKRVFSLVVGSIALVLAAPLLALIAILIRLDCPGPVIFRQTRIGEGGRAFTIFKFRTMYDGDTDDRSRPAQASDARITRIGRWLRPFRLDELPQLFNIVRGDMAFVGPRPFVPEQEEFYAANIPFYRQRWLVKPGATGWAQINRGYNSTVDDNREKLAFDLFYIKNISVGLDLYILLATIKILVLGKGGR